MKFLDQAKINVRGGAGGDGCASFRREKYVEFGGPDGGDGGRGGSVVAACVDGLNTLIDLRYRQHFRAANGRPGAGRNRTGAAGAEALVAVPAGTQILTEDKAHTIADLTTVGQRAVLARGGRAGFGNARYKSATNRAPRRADAGAPGEERWLWLRLKLIADAGLVGLPNAGKSTLLAALSQARPKVAAYPFTTLHPVLGLVEAGDEAFVMADIPGVIAGAHEGAGLGDRFLGHIERCSVLVHLVDGAEEGSAARYHAMRRELALYGRGLDEKPEIVVLTKCDTLADTKRETRAAELAAAAHAPVAPISAHSGAGLDSLLARVRSAVAREDLAPPDAAGRR